jgi:hypothetical protein
MTAWSKNSAGNRSRFGVLSEEETDLDSDGQIGNDMGHVVAEVFQSPVHSA